MKQKKKTGSIFKQFSPYMGNKKIFILLSVLFSGIAAIVNIIPFYYVWKISIEVFEKGNDISSDNLFHYALMILVFSVIGILLYFIAIILSHLAAFEVEIGMKKVGFEKVMNKPLGFLNTHSSGKIRKIINDGASQTHSFLAHQLHDMAGTIITPVMVLIIFFIVDWKFALVSMIPIILSFVAMSKMMTKEAKIFEKEYMDSLEEMSSESVEYVRSIPVVKTFGQSVKSFTRFYNAIENYKNLVIAHTRMWTKPYSIYLVIVESTAFFLLPLSIFLINSGGDIAITLSKFILYILIAPLFTSVMMRSAYFVQRKNTAEQAISRFNELFDYEEIEFPEKGVKFEAQDIEFKDVSFSYDDKNTVLNKINFKVKSGETLALVGASGSGKTTIARLVARFWDAGSGEILIGRNNIKKYSEKELMNNISFVFQNTQLFKTTLRENICFGNNNIKKEELDNALVKSRAKEIIDNLDDGLDTVIGKKGTYLSGGEQQRIALARAFIKNAPIILLDEATAFADPENEHLIQAALKELSKNKTTIMIAHRMTTVKNADNIAVVDKGKIVEYGNHEMLMEKNGLYKKMWDEYQATIEWKIKKEAV